jgi:sulfoxide reductase heme-binding subunit YedZ
MVRTLAWISGLVPLVFLGIRFMQDGLGANPIEELTHWSGKSALVFLVASLAITPLRRLTRFNELIRARRILGLLAFFYALLHFLVYAVLDQALELTYVAEDIAERPYILVGFTALVILLPLAITSTRGWIRRLGKNWTRLHRLVYLAAGLGVLHFFWLVKADLREPLIFASVLGILLVLRLPPVARRLARRS